MKTKIWETSSQLKSVTELQTFRGAMSSFLVLGAMPGASVHEELTILSSLPFPLMTLLLHSSLSHMPTLRYSHSLMASKGHLPV